MVNLFYKSERIHAKITKKKNNERKIIPTQSADSFFFILNERIGKFDRSTVLFNLPQFEPLSAILRLMLCSCTEAKVSCRDKIYKTQDILWHFYFSLSWCILFFRFSTCHCIPWYAHVCVRVCVCGATATMEFVKNYYFVVSAGLAILFFIYFIFLILFVSVSVQFGCIWLHFLCFMLRTVDFCFQISRQDYGHSSSRFFSSVSCLLACLLARIRVKRLSCAVVCLLSSVAQNIHRGLSGASSSFFTVFSYIQLKYFSAEIGGFIRIAELESVFI